MPTVKILPSQTINLSGSSYQDNPWAVAVRMEVSVEKMIKYDEDRSKPVT